MRLKWNRWETPPYRSDRRNSFRASSNWTLRRRRKRGKEVPVEPAALIAYRRGVRIKLPITPFLAR
jgi:hypothetical protein